MSFKRNKRIRFLGKILFVLYIVFIIYFLIFSDWYGRTGEMEEYHYNLVLFKEIKRFWNYREQVGMFAMLGSLCLWPASTEASFPQFSIVLG